MAVGSEAGTTDRLRVSSGTFEYEKGSRSLEAIIVRTDNDSRRLRDAGKGKRNKSRCFSIILSDEQYQF